MNRDDRVETLSEPECLRLLSTVPVGRVVYTEHALPAVLPVGFRVAADGRLMLALLAGTATSRALDGTVAAFQADHRDPEKQRGWSVLVHGHAEVVREPDVHAALLHGGLLPWISTDQVPMYVALTPELVSGRRLHPAVPAPRPHPH